jgi:hypothetical protein
MNGFSQIQQILDTAVGGPDVVVTAPHRAFWRNITRDEFVAYQFMELQIVTLNDGAGSNIVKALRGQAPFGDDIGTPDATIPRMPAGMDPVPDDQIAIIAQWIDAGCPDEVASIGTIEASLGGASSGSAFLIVSDTATAIPARLSLRTTDGSAGDVTVRAKPSSAATVQITPPSVHITGTAVEVEVTATTPSAVPNDTTIEVVAGTTVLASIDLTAVARPLLRFHGRFQCRLATDPDAFDDPWGHNSSFGAYAVQGPDPGHPDEPPLDRIVRFSDPVALRPFCAPIGVTVTGVEAQTGGTTQLFTAGDPLIGQPVRLGPDCKFDARNEAFAPNGYEPISDFRMEIGSAFAGASAPAVARPKANDPPGSTAPYANGITKADEDPTGEKPADFGIAARKTWAEYAWNVLAVKLAALVGQRPADAPSTRIRTRRIQAHAVQLSAMATPFQLMEQYTGLIDRDVTITPGAGGILAYLAALPAIHVAVTFLGFDVDCLTGYTTGTLGAAPAPGLADFAAEPRHLVRRVPLDEQ